MKADIRTILLAEDNANDVEEFTKHLQAEYDRMKEVVRLSGARIE